MGGGDVTTTSLGTLEVSDARFIVTEEALLNAIMVEHV